MFFGCVAAAAIPFVVLCLPETKGQVLEEILPMFDFDGWSGFSQFVRGNLAHGQGVRSQTAAEVETPAVPEIHTGEESIEHELLVVSEAMPKQDEKAHQEAAEQDIEASNSNSKEGDRSSLLHNSTRVAE